MYALVADGKLKEQEFQFHTVYYRDYMKNCKFYKFCKDVYGTK